MHTGLYVYNTAAVLEDYQEGLVLSCDYNLVELHLSRQHFTLYLVLFKK